MSRNEQLFNDLMNATGWLGALTAVVIMLAVVGAMGLIWLWIYLTDSEPRSKVAGMSKRKRYLRCR